MLNSDIIAKLKKKRDWLDDPVKSGTQQVKAIESLLKAYGSEENREQEQRTNRTTNARRPTISGDTAGDREKRRDAAITLLKQRSRATKPVGLGPDEPECRVP